MAETSHPPATNGKGVCLWCGRWWWEHVETPLAHRGLQQGRVGQREHTTTRLAPPSGLRGAR